MASLRLSHVIPKWALQWHKASWGGVVKTQLYSRGVEVVQQDGNKHYLLCVGCETRASVSEAYALAIVLRRRPGLRASGTRYLVSDRYWRLRIDLIAQFIAITALRVHYAESVPFAATRMPLHIRKKLRNVALGRLNFDDLAISAWRFVPPKHDPDHDPRQDLGAMYEEGELGSLAIIKAGGIEWALFFEPACLIRAVGKFGFRGRLIERIARLPYSEHRVFKYPEKWLPQVLATMDSRQSTAGER